MEHLGRGRIVKNPLGEKSTDQRQAYGDREWNFLQPLAKLVFLPVQQLSGVKTLLIHVLAAVLNILT
ncbi:MULTISPECIES: hypothetical protein [unclassified Microbulbifer]|uniref:hypothetical protein n=1 Tax=unclassified Microbulbifer TaxID=2619833 RepID=UPI0027E59FA6|nr:MULTISPECIES: hypothetical protein [unclassified Microbulbifer]